MLYTSTGLVRCRLKSACSLNLTQDHLDYHGTMDAYFEAKKMLFQMTKRRFSI